MKKLEEENEVNKYLCDEKIPKEIENMQAACINLENVMNVPAMGQSDLDEIHEKVSERTLWEGFTSEIFWSVKFKGCLWGYE